MLSRERGSRLALRYFQLIGKIPGGRFVNRLLHSNRPEGLEREVFGLSFYNPVGLGAGLDTRGDLYNDLNDFGFSFSEVGPIDAETVKYVLSRIQKDPQNDILALCIQRDYERVLSLAYDFCDFFVIELDAAADIRTVAPLLDIRLTNDEYKPLVLKLPEELPDAGETLARICDYCMMNGVDGIEARNQEQIRQIAEKTLGRLPIIANCHIKSAAQASGMLAAGASLIEVCSGFITKGPGLVRQILRTLQSENETA
ncbi:MAG: hypothetical protein J5871_04370 [Bacteroidales bacterium]|nr:hypothetical protein [Bacteroidales bacterium]